MLSPCQCSPGCTPFLSRDLLTLESCEVRRHHPRHQLLSVDLGAWGRRVFSYGDGQLHEETNDDSGL